MTICDNSGCHNLAEIQRQEDGACFLLCLNCALEIPRKYIDSDKPLGTLRRLQIEVESMHALEILKHLAKDFGIERNLQDERTRALRALQGALLERVTE